MLMIYLSWNLGTHLLSPIFHWSWGSHFFSCCLLSNCLLTTAHEIGRLLLFRYLFKRYFTFGIWTAQQSEFDLSRFLNFHRGIILKSRLGFYLQCSEWAFLCRDLGLWCVSWNVCAWSYALHDVDISELLWGGTRIAVCPSGFLCWFSSQSLNFSLVQFSGWFFPPN